MVKNTTPQNMPPLDDRRIIVTGAARGIGAAVMRAYAEAGAKVVGMDRRLREGEQAVAALSQAQRCRFVACDVSSKAAVEHAFAEADAFLGGLDVLAAIAGLDRPAPADATEEADWDLVMNVNARGTYLTNQAAHARMRADGGSIINFGSIAGIRGLPDRAAYSAAKGAVAAWSRAAALAWGAVGVRVNTVAPMMDTEVTQRYLDTLPAEERASVDARLAQQIPLGGQLGETTRDLVPLMLFLAGDGSRYITGQMFAVDGGMTMIGA